MKAQFLKNQDGFGLVGFMALMPLLIALLSFISGVVMIMKTNAKLTHECRTQLLQAQRGISQHLNQLIALNKPAQALRIARIAAEAEVIATIGVPPLNAVAITELNVIKGQQKLLNSSQKFLIGLAQSASSYAPTKASIAVGQALREEVKAVSLSQAWPRGRFNHPRFTVDESPKNDASPDYTPVQNFTDQQRMEVSLEFNLASVLPSWLKAFLPAERLRLKTACSATIEKENSKWIEKLSAVR